VAPGAQLARYKSRRPRRSIRYRPQVPAAPLRPPRRSGRRHARTNPMIKEEEQRETPTHRGRRLAPDSGRRRTDSGRRPFSSGKFRPTANEFGPMGFAFLGGGLAVGPNCSCSPSVQIRAFFSKFPSGSTPGEGPAPPAPEAGGLAARLPRPQPAPRPPPRAPPAPDPCHARP
jgi:hypothetical protein